MKQIEKSLIEIRYDNKSLIVKKEFTIEKRSLNLSKYLKYTTQFLMLAMLGLRLYESLQ
jgi:hypothetical protein